MGMKEFNVGIAVKKQHRSCGTIQKSVWTGLGFVDHFPENDPRHGKFYMHAVLLKDGKELFASDLRVRHESRQLSVASLERISGGVSWWISI